MATIQRARLRERVGEEVIETDFWLIDGQDWHSVLAAFPRLADWRRVPLGSWLLLVSPAPAEQVLRALRDLEAREPDRSRGG